MAQIRIHVKTPAPLFFQNNLTFVIQLLINVFPRIVFVRIFFFALKARLKYISVCPNPTHHSEVWVGR
jgi:hypothetical protein